MMMDHPPCRRPVTSSNLPCEVKVGPTSVGSIAPASEYNRAIMILTHEVIVREIANGRIVIDPLSPDQIGPASIDLHLGDEIRVMRGGPRVIELVEEADYR